jgi:RNA polymerase sigma-70 factor (ECF subfamily)
MAQIRHREHQRFIDIIDTYRDPLLTYVSGLVGGDTAWAEDVVQETFIRAWGHIERLGPGFGSVNGWLRRVAHNIAMDGHRRRRTRPTEVGLDHPDVANHDDPAEHIHQVMVIHSLLDSLWPEHRAVLIEVYLQDRTAAQAAQVLGVPVGTVKSRLHYALRTLRERVPQEDLLAS